MLVFLLVACSPEVPDAGDASELDRFDADNGALYSDLRDDGYDHVPGQYLVLFDRPGRVARDIADVVPAAVILQELETVPAAAVQMTHEDAVWLASQPHTRAVELDWLAEATGKPTTAGCATSSSQTVPPGVAMLGATTLTGAGVTVADIDTGVDTAHPDVLAVGGADFTGSRTGYVDDNGHGTHTAGTIAALNNAQGVIGVAPAASLYAVKVLDRRGSGSYSAIAGGIDWAVANGMDVANLSLGGPADSATLHASVTAAKNANVILVVAAGNEGGSATNSWPAAYDGEVITVSAVSNSGAFASWSNYGVPPIDVAAPGVVVCSTTKGGAWGLMDGTSMAAPHVTGAVALYLERHPGAGFAEVEAAVKANVAALADTSRHTEDLAIVSGY